MIKKEDDLEIFVKNSKNYISDKLADKVKMSGLSIKEAVKKTEISESSFRLFLNGSKRNITLDTLLRLIYAFDMNLKIEDWRD